MGRDLHPSTFILFRPATCDMLEDGFEETVFPVEVETDAAPKMSYKKSCPALLGTASKKLQRINEDQNDNDGDSSIDDDSGDIARIVDDLALASHSSQRSNGNTQKQLSKKRSFLLVDVIDDVEGTRGYKRHDICEASSTFSTDSIEIEHSANRSARRLKRQKSDFDVLYADSRTREVAQHQSSSIRVATRPHQSNDPELSESYFDVSPVAIRHSHKLRNHKSMITLSLKKLGSSATKSRLDGIDTEEMTSFDTVLQDCTDFKAATAETILSTRAAVAPLSCSKDKINRMPLRSVAPQPKFAKNTELLKQLPDTSSKPRRARRSLRHAKSARDVLEKYRTKAPTEKSAIKNFSLPMPSKKEKQQEMTGQGSDLKAILRSLLRMKKRA